MAHPTGGIPATTSPGEIIELGLSRIAVVADSPPWELGGRWRLDRGANKTAYERTSRGSPWEAPGEAVESAG